MTVVLNIVFTLFLSFITIVFSCPDGFIERKTEKSLTCCKPRNCSRNEGFSLCNGTDRSPGEDQCNKCPSGKYNWDPVDTRWMPKNLELCQPPDCQCTQAEAMISNSEKCKSGQSLKVCECNRSGGFYGHDPNNCHKADDAVISQTRQPGSELTEDGQVKRCKPGFFKSSADTSVCKPQKICKVKKAQGTPTRDNICVIMDKPLLDVPESKDLENTTFPVESNSTETKGEDQIYIYVIVAIGVVIIILILTAVLLWRCGIFASICSKKYGVNIPNQNINERAQISLTHIDSHGIYDEIGLARRLTEQTDHIRVVSDTGSQEAVEEEDPFIPRQIALLDVNFSDQNSFTILSQESEYGTSDFNDNTSLKMSISQRNVDANPEQEETNGKVFPGGNVVTEVDMINMISNN